MKISIVFAALVLGFGLQLHADKTPNVVRIEKAKPKPINITPETKQHSGHGITFECNVEFKKAGKVIAEGDPITVGTVAHLSTTITGLTEENLKGRRLAYQVVRDNEVRSLIWLDIPKSELGKPSLKINGDYTYDRTGFYMLQIGLADTAKSQWYVVGGAGCKVTK